MARSRTHPDELWGIEDPRITFVDTLVKYVVTYTALSSINLYYGAADTSIALAKGSITQILGWLDRHGAE